MKEKKRKKEEQQYDFCETCRLNHNQGRRHVYFPRHQSAVSALLTSFQSKVADVKFFLKYPMPLTPEIAYQSQFWCLFCNSEVLEHGSKFSCGNAISHLASLEHWKKVKEFMWKNGAGMDRVDAFCITDVDFEKWEKKLNSNKAVKDPVGGVFVGPLNNIHNDQSADFASSFYEANAGPRSFHIQNNVLPLQIYTTEEAQVSRSEPSSVSEAASSIHFVPRLALEGGLHNHRYSNSLGAHSRSGYVNNGGTANVDGRAPGVLRLTQISQPCKETIEGNVHTGAPPPWFNITEGDHPDIMQKPGVCPTTAPKPAKPSKLNPKRVGAAWAERRKHEMELESRGEFVASTYDSSWLPNFGRVWQSGTRKDSKKEFHMESKGSVQIDDKSPTSSLLQPYISKRKRVDNVQP